jgi:hypothetical protein
MEEEVCGLRDRSGAATEAPSGGERQAEESGAELSLDKAMLQDVLAKKR